MKHLGYRVVEAENATRASDIIGAANDSIWSFCGSRLIRINGKLVSFGDYLARRSVRAAIGVVCAARVARRSSSKGRTMPIRRRQDRDWSCRRCPSDRGACCGALLGGAGRLTVDKHCLIRQSTSSVGPDEIVYHAGATANAVFAVCQGWAMRFIALPDGRRQNLAVLLPGDLSVGALFQEQLHYSVAAVTPLRITHFPGVDLKRRILGDAEMLDILGKASAEEQRDIDQRVVDLGRRSAEERVAHLLLSLVERMSQHGARPNHAYQLPLLQRHIADLTGLTPVHVSRVTTEFRNAGLMRLAQGFLTILDLAGVQRIAGSR